LNKRIKKKRFKAYYLSVRSLGCCIQNQKDCLNSVRCIQCDHWTYHTQGYCIMVKVKAILRKRFQCEHISLRDWLLWEIPMKGILTIYCYYSRCLQKELVVYVEQQEDESLQFTYKFYDEITSEDVECCSIREALNDYRNGRYYFRHYENWKKRDMPSYKAFERRIYQLRLASGWTPATWTYEPKRRE